MSHEQVCVLCAINRNSMLITKPSALGKASISVPHSVYDDLIAEDTTVYTDEKRHTVISALRTNCHLFISKTTNPAKEFTLSSTSTVNISSTKLYVSAAYRQNIFRTISFGAMLSTTLVWLRMKREMLSYLRCWHFNWAKPISSCPTVHQYRSNPDANNLIYSVKFWLNATYYLIFPWISGTNCHTDERNDRTTKIIWGYYSHTIKWVIVAVRLLKALRFLI